MGVLFGFVYESCPLRFSHALNIELALPSLPIRFHHRRGSYELSWHYTRIIEFTRPSLAFGLYLFQEHCSLHFFGLWLRLGKPWREVPCGQILESWSFHAYLFGSDGFGRCIHLNWGARTKILHLPWEWGSNYRHDVMNAEGKLVKAPDWRETPVAHFETHPYTYKLKSGEIQERLATIHVEEREWRWRWLQWSSWPSKVVRCISITFDKEVGERSGSWKGGTTGCGYEMKPGETALQTLRRMERERAFD